MLRRVRLQHFLGFESFVANTELVNVCVGPNGSGKTALLSAIRFACLILRWAIREGHVHEYSEERQSQEVIRLSPPSHLYYPVPWLTFIEPDELYFNHLSQSIEIDLTFDDSDVLQGLDVDVDEGGNIGISVRCASIVADVAGMAYGSEPRAEAILNALDAACPFPVFVPPFSGATFHEEYRTSAAVNQMISTGRQSQVVRNLATRLNDSQFAKLQDIVRNLTDQVIRSITSEGEREEANHLELLFSTPGATLELSSMGAGIGSIVAIFAAVLRYCKNGASLPAILLVDEPEAHLHPRLQADVALELSRLSHEFGVQLLVATHSVEVINRLSNAGDAIVIAIDRCATQAVPLPSQEKLLAELGRWCDLTPFSSIALLKSRKVLFHEGPSDAEILRCCAEIYHRGHADAIESTRGWVFQPMSGAGNAKMSELLKHALTPVIRSDPSGPRLRVVRVLDRDYSRMPTISVTSTDSLFESWDVVWSHHSIESLFLSAECISAWLFPQVTRLHPISQSDFADMVSAAIEEADSNEELLSDARNQLMLTIAGKARDDASLVRASRTAEQEVRAHPRIWQHGRHRASAVLAGIRERLPARVQNRVPGSIPRMISAGVFMVDPQERNLLIPDEVRQLLTILTQEDEAS